ncbi:TPA: hypothetical protein ACXE5P_003536, partial [Klebsiella pneumoniae]
LYAYLSGKSPLEAIDFPVPFKGEQAIRCMADGEVVAYRICKDYQTVAWESGPLNFSGSFVLVKHYIQPGETKSSGLHFYTLYMHLAPYSAYESESENQWITQDTLKAFSEMDWLTAKLTSEQLQPQIAGYMPVRARVEWDSSDASLNAVGYNQRRYGLVTLKSLPDADGHTDAKKKVSTSLIPGKRYWVVVDNNNIKPAPGAGPSWWRRLMPPAKEVMKFDQVVCPTPWAITAGDPVGHMGYYQAPKDGGYEARYQVHIECTSMDDNLEKFLTNPEKVGEKNPLWLKYSPGLALYKKDVATGTFTKDTRVTTRIGILPLKQVQTEVDKSTRQEYWQLRPENAYVPKGQAEPQLLSQYDLAKLGFRTETAEPASFDYLDGKNQPTGFFRNLIDSLYQAATNDPRTSHALVKHNYQRLLDKIDSGSDRYSPMEYWRALHNPDYRDVVQKTIVKHPSDWYFKKDDVIWQPFLNALKKDAPEWKKYSEDFLDKMAWMPDLTTEKLGPSLWHMHPIMFLGTMISVKKRQSGLFTVQDGKEALCKIYNKYGKNMSVIVERMFRIETKHFTSGQYQHCGAPGMEVHGAPPAYGWSSDFFSQHPEYQPTGIWSKKEGRGLSGQGGNSQVTDKPKQFVVFDSVESSMEYIVYYINKHGGNYARWYSTQDSAQKLYREECGAIKPRFTNEFSEVKS